MSPKTSATASQTAKIREWNREKGYGFLQVGNERVFLHWRDFAERHKAPAAGDVIQFTLGKDAQGRRCAVSARHANDGGRLTLLDWLVMAGLLVLPVLAWQGRGGDFFKAAGYLLLMGGLTYLVYARDKQRARGKRWRINEGNLHLLELLGGWPGGWLAQRHLRHKCSKRSYQIVFWLVVLAWQVAALDSLQHWRYFHQAWEAVAVAWRDFGR